jgi:sterol desaturase/sphingolipid hydroxylase (fatty acid hydroxylase superfamily)
MFNILFEKCTNIFNELYKTFIQIEPNKLFSNIKNTINNILPSSNSIKIFFFTNSFIISLTFVEQYFMLIKFDNILINCIIKLFVIIIKNYILLNITIYNLKDKEHIIYDNKERKKPMEQYYREFDVKIIIASLIETITLIYIEKTIIFSYINDNSYVRDLILFVPTSFIYEIIFDLFHYITHRLCHTNKFLYKHVHKEHHKFIYVEPVITFHQSCLDLIITNSIPNIIALHITKKIIDISYFQYLLIKMFLTYIEIGGHTGKETKNTCSFPQFIWLPKMFNIELYTRNHDMHHYNQKYNYSKRFSLWDKIFGTYKQ